MQITAKIIATDTAEIVGAGQSRVVKDEEVTQLLGRGIESGGSASTESGNGSTSDGSPPRREFSATNTVQKFGSYNVQLLSFRVLPNGTAFAALQVVNTSKQTTIAVGMNCIQPEDSFSLTPKIYPSAKIADENGNFIRGTHQDGLYLFGSCQQLVERDRFGFDGIQYDRSREDYRWVDNCAEIKPSEALRFTLEFDSSEEGRRQGKRRQAGGYITLTPPGDENRRQEAQKVKLGKVFKLQAELITIVKKGSDDKPNPKLDNIYFDNITISSPIAVGTEQSK